MTLVTDDPQRFLDHVRPGDVLLFDKLNPISALIQLCENRPVNHAALYVGDDRFLNVTSHEPGAPAVQEGSILERTGDPHYRTITALRHRSVQDGDAGVDDVVGIAERYAEQATSYCYRDLFVLALPAAFRAYRDLLKGKDGRWCARLVEAVASVLAEGYEPGAAGDAATLTCSEFVYRCYLEAGRVPPISVTDPLVCRLIPGRESSQAGATDADPVGGLSAIELVELDLGRSAPDAAGSELAFHPALDEFADDPAAVESTYDGARLAEMARLARGWMTTLWQLNRGRLKYRAADELVPPLSDSVTPGDLWASPSLVARTVFHRPAGSTGLEPPPE